MVRILKLWFKHIFSTEILRIISGNFNRLFKRHSGLYIRRYDICRKCSERETVKPIGEICGICGCPLKSKLTVLDETCALNKWQ